MKISKTKQHTRNIELSDGTKVVANDNNKKHMSQKKVYARAKPDPEKNKPPKDKYSKLKYPPPKNDPVFRRKWGNFIDNVVARTNFNTGHLDLLEILCDLLVEMETLNAFLRTHGRTYKVITVLGEIWRTYPEVGQLNSIRAQVQQYSKQLDLFPKKDKQQGGRDPAAAGEWG